MRRQRATTTTKKEREIKCKRQMEITFHLLKKMKMDTKERNEQLKKNIVDGEDVLHEREMIILLCASPVVFLHIFFFFYAKIYVNQPHNSQYLVINNSAFMCVLAKYFIFRVFLYFSSLTRFSLARTIF